MTAALSGWRIPGLAVQFQLEAGERLRDRFQASRSPEVCTVSPLGYDAYARIFFPFASSDGVSMRRWGHFQMTSWPPW